MMTNKERQILQLLEDSYFGTGGFEFCVDDSAAHYIDSTGRGSYLVKHHREIDVDYLERIRLAYYLNYVQPVVDSHVAPIFRRGIERDVKASQQVLWDAFAADATGGHVPLADLMRSAATPAKRDGIHILVMSLPDKLAPTVADAQTVRPFIYQVHALEIEDLKRDRFGNIILLRHPDTFQVDGTPKTVSRELTGTGWRILDGEQVVESGDWVRPLPTAPCVEISPGLQVRGAMLPRSEFVAVARANHRLFNLQSELDEVFRNQAFSILTYPSTDLSQLTVGVNNALGFPEDSRHPPAYISPAADPSKMLMEQFDRIVREIYRMSLLSHQTGTTGKTQQQQLPSGVALRIDRESLDSALTDFAKTLQTAEEQIVALWCWATGETATDVTIVYPCEFTLQDMATELQPLLDAWGALAANAPAPLKTGILELIAKLLFADDEETLEEVRAALEAMLQDDNHDDEGEPPASTSEDGSGDGGEA